MTHNRMTTGALAFVLMMMAPKALSQDLGISWYTIDGGGGVSTGSGFTVSGTIGQPDAGVLSGGDLTLTGGFWAAGAEQPCSLPGDITGDGAVDLTDLAIVLANYGVPSGAAYEDGDLDGDGDVDLADLAIVLAAYGTACP